MLLRKRTGSMAAATVLAMALTACADRDEHGDLRTILADMQQATIPPEATDLHTSPAVRNQSAATADWSFWVPMRSDTYRGWVLDNIEGHHVSHDTDTLLVVSCRDPGDIHRLEIRMAGDGPLNVYVSYRGMAD